MKSPFGVDLGQRLLYNTETLCVCLCLSVIAVDMCPACYVADVQWA